MTNRELIYQTKKLIREVNADTRLPAKLIHSIAKKHSRLLIYRDSERLKLTKKIKTISQKIVFITAGNQGSHLINLIIKKISQEMPEYFFIHQTGNNDFSEFKKLEKYKCLNSL